MTEFLEYLLSGIDETNFEKRQRVVKHLLNFGAPVNAKSAILETPLHLAVRNNCLGVAQLLMQHKANVDEVNKDRRTPLHFCAEFCDSEMAEALLENSYCEHRSKDQELFESRKIQIANYRLECSKQRKADAIRTEILDELGKCMEYFRKKRTQKADNSCNNSCLSLLDSVYKELQSNYNYRLIKCHQLWTFNQNAKCRLHIRSHNRMFKKLRISIGRKISSLKRYLLMQLSEMKTFNNSATPLHLAVRSCRSSSFFAFQSQFPGLTNDDASTKDITPTDLFRFVSHDADKINSPRHFNSDFSNERKQSEILELTDNVKSYVNRKDSEGYDGLLKAVEFNRSDVVQLLLKNGADTCSITSQGYAALHIAVNSFNRGLKSSNPVAVIQILLTSGEFSVNALTYKAETPLHLAVSNCGCGVPGQDLEECQCRREMQDSVISLLLENKANLNQQDCEGMTPLMIASERGCDHIVRMLLNGLLVKVDLDARDQYGETALMKAVRMHRDAIVELLVNSGSRVDLQDYRGFTALHAALHDPDEFRSLLELFENESQGIGPRNNEEYETVYSRDKDTALVRATNSLNGERDCENCRKNTMIKILLRSGLQFEILDFANNTPFDFLVYSEIQSSRSEQEAQQRLDKMRNENNVYEETPCNLHRRWLDIKWRRESPLFWLAAVCIMIAEHKGIQTEEAKEIPRIKDYKGRTLLHYAAMSTGNEQLSDRNSLFKILLTLGCRIDEKDIYKRTPLHYLDVSSSNLLFGVAQQIGMESTEKQRMIFRDKFILKIKDLDDKTVDELRSLREGIAERERTRKSDYHQTVKAVDLDTIRFDNGTMKINKKDTYDFETGISWSIWMSGIADYAHRNTVTPCLTEEIHYFIERLANAIERKEPCFKCQPMLVGSAFEGTKIDSPDEFDFDFILTNFSNTVEVIPSPVAPEGFVHLRRKPNVRLGETDERFFDEEGILKTNEINCRCQIVLRKVFQDPSFLDDEHLFESTDAEDTMKRFVRWYDRHKNGRDLNDLTDQRINPGICATIRLKQSRALEGQYLPNDISLDLVPCIHVDGWWPDKARSDTSDTLKANGCNLVFDQPQRKYPWVPFGENYARISFAPAESQIIRDSSPTAKAAYMVCKHLIKDKPQMTYVLKTCLLYCIEALDIENERSLDEETNYSSVTAEKLSSWVERLMQCYLMFFLQNFCPCYLMPSFCLPIGEFLKSNHMLQHVTAENDYEFLKEENQSYLCSFREVYIANFDLFRRVCTRDIDIPLPKPQPLCESFNHAEFISELRESKYEIKERERSRKRRYNEEVDGVEEIDEVTKNKNKRGRRGVSDLQKL